jgi:putative ABC transport system permease protein
MRIRENFSMALKNLQSNVVRSTLTMLGVIIGVMAVIVMVSLGEGAKKQVTQNITAMGSNLLIVFPGHGQMQGGSFGGGTTITNATLPVIQHSSNYISAISPEARGRGLISAGPNSYQTSIIGCMTSYLQVRNYSIDSGVFFTDEDIRARRRVAVLGSYVVDQVFPGENPVGREMKIGTLRVKIIGVLKSKGQSGFGNNDDLILMPITTVQARVTGNKNLSSIYIQIQNEQAMDLANTQISNALLAYFKGDDTKYNIRNQAEILSTVQQTTQTFTFLLGGVAAISLLVGGIGIMNIMLVSVTERIKEIGIRKAIGAPKEEILALFLIEAITLSVTGGLIGIGLGWLMSTVVASVSGWQTSITLLSVMISFIFSIFTGLFFGVYPAYKAAGLHPIDALRYE